MSPRYWAWLEVGEVMESSLLFSTVVALVLNLEAQGNPAPPWPGGEGLYLPCLASFLV